MHPEESTENAENTRERIATVDDRRQTLNLDHDSDVEGQMSAGQ